VIGCHELGHALVAEYYGVTIKRISLGFGRILWRWRDKRDREWALSLWPAGGYVYLLNSRLETVSASAYFKCFDKKNALQRLMILIAGAVANLFIAWIAFACIEMTGYQRLPPITITGDCYLQVNHQPVRSWSAVGEQLLINMGKKSVPVLLQNKTGQTHFEYIDLSKWHYQTHQKNALLSGLGIVPDVAVSRQYVKGVGILKAFYRAGIRVYQILWFDLLLLKQLFLGALPLTLLMGPLNFFSQMAHAISAGVMSGLLAIANTSIAVALINLLPIPGLDGGHIVYVMIEKIRGKPLTLAMEQLLYRLVFIGFCVLMIQFTMNDLQRYFDTTY